jgi:hypothetical protein
MIMCPIEQALGDQPTSEMSHGYGATRSMEMNFSGGWRGIYDGFCGKLLIKHLNFQGKKIKRCQMGEVGY